MKITLGKCLMACGVLIVALIGFCWIMSMGSIRFYWKTGYWKPWGAKVIATDDDHGGFHGDGEFYYVFQTEDSIIRKWLKGPAPWVGGWK